MQKNSKCLLKKKMRNSERNCISEARTMRFRQSLQSRCRELRLASTLRIRKYLFFIRQECTKTVPKGVKGRRIDKCHKITEISETDRDVSHNQSLKNLTGNNITTSQSKALRNRSIHASILKGSCAFFMFKDLYSFAYLMFL